MLKRILSTSLLCFSTQVLAFDLIYDSEQPLPWSSIIILSGGPSWSTAGQDQYLYPNPIPQFNHYVYNSPTSTLANGEIFFGLQRFVYPNVIGQLGLGVAGASDAKITGFVNVDGLGNLYSYQYKVNHARIELKGKLIGNFFQPVQPYLSGSLGAAFNHSHDFNSTSLYPALYPSPWFAESTNVAFAYSLGTGLQMMLNPNWQVGLGYEWVDFGKSFLGQERLVLPKGPRLTHLYTNELLFSLGYVFT